VQSKAPKYCHTCKAWHAPDYPGWNAGCVNFSAMTPDERLAWLKERYRETYAWVNSQPCTSLDFVSVPIESLASLLHDP